MTGDASQLVFELTSFASASKAYTLLSVASGPLDARWPDGPNACSLPAIKSMKKKRNKNRLPFYMSFSRDGLIVSSNDEPFAFVPCHLSNSMISCVDVYLNEPSERNW